MDKPEGWEKVCEYLTEHNYSSFAGEIREVFTKIELINEDPNSLSSHKAKTQVQKKDFVPIAGAPSMYGLGGFFNKLLTNPALQNILIILMLMALCAKAFM